MCLSTRQPVIGRSRGLRRCCYREIESILTTVYPPFISYLPQHHVSQHHCRLYTTSRENRLSPWNRKSSLSSSSAHANTTLGCSLHACKRASHIATGHQTLVEEDSSVSEQRNSSDISTAVRLLMRRVPHPVTIITAAETTQSTSADHPPAARDRRQDQHISTPKDTSRVSSVKIRGMTASSFNTVTLHPQPVVSFNVKRPSETLNTIQSSGRFYVHLLAPNPDTAQLARAFSRGNENIMHLLESRQGPKFEFIYEGQPNRKTFGMSQSQPLPSSPSSLPILRRSPKTPPSVHNYRNGGTSDCEKETTNTMNTPDFPFILECQLLPNHEINIHDHSIVLGTVTRVIQHQGSALSHLQNRHQIPSPNSIQFDSVSLPDDSSKMKMGNNEGEAALTPAEKEVDSFCLMYADTHFWTVGRKVPDS